MDLSKYFFDQYDFEIARKAALSSALSIPIGLVTLLAGGLAVMAKDIRVPLDTHGAVLLGAVGLSLLLALVAVGYLVASHHSYAYLYMPDPLALKRYQDELTAKHLSAGKDETTAKQLAEAETADYIVGELLKNTSANAGNNDRKSRHLHLANRWTIAACASSLLGGTVYVHASITNPPSVPRVEVVNMKEHADGQTIINSSGDCPRPGSQPKPKSRT